MSISTSIGEPSTHISGSLGSPGDRPGDSQILRNFQTCPILNKLAFIKCDARLCYMTVGLFMSLYTCNFKVERLQHRASAGIDEALPVACHPEIQNLCGSTGINAIFLSLMSLPSCEE